MEGLNLAPVLIPLAALLVGWVIGFFDSNMRTSKKIKEAEAKAAVAIKQAEEKMAQAETSIASTPGLPVMVDDPGLLRLKNENGILTLDLDGTRVNTSSFSTEQRKRLIELLTVMRPWLEGKPASLQSIQQPAPPPQPVVAPVQPVQSAPQPIITTPPPTITSKPAPAKKDDKPAGAPTTMIGQIDAILQIHIANSPLAGRGISIMQTPSGEVNVFVGLERYEGIDAVKDEEVKAAIRAAIAEWEKKYTPGLK